MDSWKSRYFMDDFLARGYQDQKRPAVRFHGLRSVSYKTDADSCYRNRATAAKQRPNQEERLAAANRRASDSEERRSPSKERRGCR